MKIKVIIEKCTGCGLCEVICSLSHTGTVDRKKSAVKIIMDDLGESIHKPLVCKQCEKMKCLDSELKDNPCLNIEAEKEKFIWEMPERAELCPFDGCFAFKGKVYHCDLCGGQPKCVRVCTQGALINQGGRG